MAPSGKPRRMHKTLLLVFVLLFLGCSSSEPIDLASPPPAQESPAETESQSAATEPTFSEEARDKGQAILTVAGGKRVDFQLGSDPVNAEPLLWVVHNAEGDTKVSALSMLSRVWTNSERDEKRMQTTPAYHQVIVSALGSEDPKVKLAAIKAARLSVSGETPDESVMAKLLALGNDPKPETVYAAMQVLGGVRQASKNPQIVDIYLKALKSDQTYLVSSALFRLRHSSYMEPQVAMEAVWPLLDHSDPGVKARAAEVAARHCPDDKKDELGTKVEAWLADENGFAVGTACSVLARLKRTKSIPKIAKLLDNSEKNTYDIEFTNLAGGKDRVHHDASAWSRIDESAIKAIAELSGEVDGATRLPRPDIKMKTKDTDLEREKKAAKAWVASHAAKL